jgi:hypothetical protein
LEAENDKEDDEDLSKLASVKGNFSITVDPERQIDERVYQEI